MAQTIAELYAQIKPDTVREQLGVSPELESAQSRIFEAKNADEVARILAEWLHRFQPCLFGRMAAKMGLIHFCCLDESDLTKPDEALRDKIQLARTAWTRDGFQGKKSAFVILAFSRRLASAEPNAALMQFAQRLCALYLLEETIEPDAIYNDEIFLEKPGDQRATWKWLAGVNVFSASADRRWWQDHRIPGGLGFSVNSVGHLVKSGKLAKGLHDLDALLGALSESLAVTKVDSLEKALEFAMRTIWGASEAVSGKATNLVPIPNDPSVLPVSKCPAELPHFLADKNYCSYSGYYHTDVTIPSDYFLPDVTRPDHVQPQDLDFTYLFRSHVDNPGHNLMGMGRLVRGISSKRQVPTAFRSRQTAKYRIGEPEELRITDAGRLAHALRVD